MFLLNGERCDGLKILFCSFENNFIGVVELFIWLRDWCRGFFVVFDDFDFDKNEFIGILVLVMIFFWMNIVMDGGSGVWSVFLEFWMENDGMFFGWIV